mmetsp:Transcript_21616/g.50498  ORF Transcript_21616/g.50498 Transcript_21616/m.50498 type:complete len:615 (+) Transcript_21616:210-2054(+)
MSGDLCGACRYSLRRLLIIGTVGFCVLSHSGTAASVHSYHAGQHLVSEWKYDGSDAADPTEARGYEALEEWPAIQDARRKLLKLVPELGISDNISLPVVLVPVVLGFAMLLLVGCSLMDFRKGQLSESQVTPRTHLPTWSKPAIFALTSYRFYTGFLSATWMPYLLAMEGRALMDERQSVFMGTAKLIYGLSILLNPVFGLVGDQAATVSRWSGRRSFILLGVAAGGLGIYGCLVAASIEDLRWYLAGVVLWMLGEAMADVTTETLVPELLPRSQYEVSSQIRSLNFLLGGLLGYVALIAFRGWHFSWLYYAYLFTMLLCAFLSLCLIDAEDLGKSQVRASASTVVESPSLKALVVQAYVSPARCEGGFPRACLCQFIFSLGSAPMFFLLLMIRDIVGIQDEVVLQTHFGAISILFFIAAALASVLGTIAAKAACDASDDAADEAADGEGNADEGAGETLPASRWHMMISSTAAFGAIALAIPFQGLFPTQGQRVVAFYIVAALWGLSFGSVYARFQECTWSLLPSGVDIANAMGYAAMCKLAGVGIGNFVAGYILDGFVKGHHSYQLRGYFIMCACCAIAVFASAGLAYTIAEMEAKRRDQHYAGKVMLGKDP